ncbi:MAG: LysM peptidoglycan-binding domain-containing protein [Treponema sp.]|jgi:hypothetical protein|nr:LysM peptidoglycan-binding domain-containing protein [Treponema sp.]
MASTIGIKVANGDFYPIMEENSPVKKRLVLTTVHDDQKSVQIDLYNSFAKTMADALYVGSLVIENIKARPKGEPSIEMILASNAAGEISVDVVDMDSSTDGEKHHLSVSLTSLEEDPMDDAISDFELDSGGHPPRGLYDKASSPQPSQKKSSPWILVTIAAILLLLIGGLLYFFFLNDTGIAIRTGLMRRTAVSVPETPVPAVPAAQTPAVPAAPAAQTPAPAVPVISASRQTPGAADSGAARPGRTQSRPPVASYKVPRTIPRGGASYRIRWGDTLWDISEAFYRNPWLYPRIARFNNIRNPDFIISGTVIRIPPRN